MCAPAPTGLPVPQRPKPCSSMFSLGVDHSLHTLAYQMKLCTLPTLLSLAAGDIYTKLMKFIFVKKKNWWQICIGITCNLNRYLRKLSCNNHIMPAPTKTMSKDDLEFGSLLCHPTLFVSQIPPIPQLYPRSRHQRPSGSPAQSWWRWTDWTVSPSHHAS